MSKFGQDPVFKGHNSNIAEMIRNSKQNKESNYFDNSLIRIEDKMHAFEILLFKNCDEDTINKLNNLIRNIMYFYKVRYPEKDIDEIISKKLYDNSDYGLIPMEILTKMLTEEELELLDSNFNNNYSFSNENIDLKFYVNNDETIDVIQAQYKKMTKNGERSIDLKEDFDGLTLKQLSDILSKYKLNDVGQYVNSVKSDYIYKKIILNNLFNFIMYAIIRDSKSIEGCKKALLIASDIKDKYNINIEIPMLYGMSFDDKESLKFIQLYENLGGRMNALCIPEYFSLEAKTNKGIINNAYPLHTYKDEYLINSKKTLKK